MESSPFDVEKYNFSADENDLFDENLDRFDNEQYKEFEDGIGFSEILDENELEDGDDTPITDEDEFFIPSNEVSDPEMDEYDDLED